MAKCEICGKGVHFGNNVSHSHRRSNRVWKSNVQHVAVKVNGATKRMNVCQAALDPTKLKELNFKNKITRIIPGDFFALLFFY